MINFVSKDAMNIVGLGESTVRQFYSEGLLANIQDIYALKDKEERLLKLDGFSHKSVSQLLRSIEESKDRGLARVLTGLGIPLVGKTTARRLAQSFGDIDALLGASADDLAKIDDIGEKIAMSIVSYFAKADVGKTIERLKRAGVVMVEDVIGAGRDDSWKGKTFVITGSFEGYDRAELTEMVQRMGGKVSSSVSKNTDYVVVGEKAGSKLAKARELGVATLSLEAFLTMVNNTDFDISD